MQEKKPPIPRDSFVNRVVIDKNKHPNVQLLSGFLGDASEAGQTRLYFDPELSDYVDIPDDAILHTEPMSKETSPLGGFFVWIDKEREVTHGRAGEQRTKARFLEGRIQQAQMKQAAASQQMLSQMPYPPLDFDRSVPWINCIVVTDYRTCYTRRCPSRDPHITCPAVICTLAYPICRF